MHHIVKRVYYQWSVNDEVSLILKIVILQFVIDIFNYPCVSNWWTQPEAGFQYIIKTESDQLLVARAGTHGTRWWDVGQQQ